MKTRLKKCLRCVLDIIPDRVYLQIMYKKMMGITLNLVLPRTFNEKLQWLKVNDRNNEYTMMVDKYLVRDYIASKIGEEYLIPLIGVWDSPDEIDFEQLPNQFVLKCNHNSGLGMCICKDKYSLDFEKVKTDISEGMKQNYYLSWREWPYKNVKPRIIAEKYMTDADEELDDYKIFNFNGVPKVILVCRDRFKESGLTEDFFSDQWEHLDMKRPGHPNSGKEIPRPAELEEMLELARILSKDIPFVRTDFYTINHKVYFGELTFYPASGFEGFEPEEWDKKLGDWLILPLAGGVLLRKENIFVLVATTQKSEELKDYKFFCFNGKVKCFKIDFDRFTNHRANYYDAEMNLLPFGEEICPPDFSRHFDKPENFDKMISLAEKLSQGIPFLRVDFYNINGKIYFGELTFYPASGFGKFVPEEWDEILGSWLELPTNKLPDFKVR